MSALSIQPTFPIFTETNGLPLENGYIWIGAANLDPQGNPIIVYWDAALTIPAAQPIRTLNGYPSRSGTPARMYVNSDYSIRVQDSKGSLVYSAPAATERYSAEQVIYDPPFTDAVSTNVEAKLEQTISVMDFGAVGDGVADDTAAIQNALNYVDQCGGGTLVFPSAMYKITSKVTQYSTTKVELEKSYIDCSSCTTIAWEIAPTAVSGTIITKAVPYRVFTVMEGGSFSGVANPGTDNVFNPTLTGINIIHPNLVFNNVVLTGFNKAVNFGNIAYVITFNDCIFCINNIAWNSDVTGNINMGAFLNAIGTSFAHNNYDIYNNSCELNFIDCSFDSSLNAVVKDNISGSGGAFNSMLIFKACRFERFGQVGGTEPVFKNSGLMKFDDCKLYEPMFSPYLFTNNAEIQINGGLCRLTQGANFYLSNGTGTFDFNKMYSSQYTVDCIYLSPKASGIFNSDFELGTTAGWSVTTGSGANMTITSDAYHGSSALQLVSGGSNLVAQSVGVPIPTNAGRLLVNLFYKNANANQIVVNLIFYSSDNVVLSQSGELGSTFSVFTLMKFNVVSPNGAAYFKLSVAMTAADTLPFIIDDLFVNFY